MADTRNPATFPLPGHALAYKGAALTPGGDPIHPSQFWTGTGGQGHAKCECGAISPEVGGRKYRRAWHVEHKTAIRNEYKEN